MMENAAGTDFIFEVLWPLINLFMLTFLQLLKKKNANEKFLT